MAIYRGHTNMVRLFLEHGLSPNPAPDFREELEKRDWLWVCSTAELQHPAAIDAKHGHKPILRLLIAYGAGLYPSHEQCRCRYTKIEVPLIEAAHNSHVSIIKLLLDQRCHPHPCEINQYHNPLFSAEHLDLEDLQLFFDAGADPYFTTGRARSNLFDSAWACPNIELVEFFLKHDPGDWVLYKIF